MKTSKEVREIIANHVRENILKGEYHFLGLQYNLIGDSFQQWVDFDWGADIDFDSYEYRVKPKTITINGVEIPKPLSESDMVNIEEKGAVYYPCSNKTLYSLESRNYSVVHKAWKNISYATKEEAIEASKALFGIEG